MDPIVQDKGSTGKKFGMLRSMLPQKATREVSQQRMWLSTKWAGKGDGIVGAEGVDNSLRCEMSGICEGSKSCQKGSSHPFAQQSVHTVVYTTYIPPKRLGQEISSPVKVTFDLNSHLNI
jgi:hypothetical protein